MQSCPSEHVQAGLYKKNKQNETATQDLFYKKTTVFCNLP